MKRTLLSAVLALLLAVWPDYRAPLDAGGARAQDTRAQQQEPPKRRGFFETLFGRRKPPSADPDPVKRKPKRSTTRAARAPKVEVIPKEEGARRILVVGDFVAGATARGLDATFADEPRLQVINRSNGNSGIVRDDYYDWGGVLPGLLNEEKPDIVVVVIGSNDRQQIKSGGSRHARLSEEWVNVYTQRIAGIADTLKVFGRPFFWVGAAPMSGSSAFRDMSTFNGFYKAGVGEAGGYYVDVWNGFTDENGRYVSSGPDVEGQLRALRTKDGINFTRAGRLKLAFFVEREIKRRTGIGKGATDVLLLSSPTSKIEIGPDGKRRLVGPVISLAGPRPGASEVLAGDHASEDAGEPEVGAEIGDDSQATGEGVESISQSLHYLMIVKGAELPRVPGRADDYAWPAATAGEPVVVEPVSLTPTSQPGP